MGCGHRPLSLTPLRVWPQAGFPGFVFDARSLCDIPPCFLGTSRVHSECHLCLLAVPKEARVLHPRAASLAQMRTRDQEPDGQA